MSILEDVINFEIERRKQHEKLRGFVPNGAQEEFINAIATPLVRTIIFPAANGVGKTCSAIATIAAIIYPELAEHKIFQQDFFQHFENTGYPKRIRIISTGKEVESTGSIQAEIQRWFPRGRYITEKGGKTFVNKMFTDNGFVIDIMTYDQDIDQFEGATLGIIIFNEPPPEPIYNACMARLRYGGKVIMPMTPLYTSAWIKDRLIDDGDHKKTRVIYGDIEANCKEHGKNGLLPHSAIEDMLAGYDPDEIDARAHGKFMHLSGQIFKGFDRTVHVSNEVIIPEKDATFFQVVDPAIGKPIAAIWAFVDKTGRIVVYDEIPDFDFHKAKDSNLTVKDYREIFIGREGGRTIHNRILDRHFGNVRRSLGGLTLKQEFAEVGIDFYDSYRVSENMPEVETGIMKVKEYLRYNVNKKMDSLNVPLLTISANCINLVKSLERWARDPKTGKPKEDYKDHADCLRYLVMANPEHEVLKTWTSPTPSHYGVGN